MTKKMFLSIMLAAALGTVGVGLLSNLIGVEAQVFPLRRVTMGGSNLVAGTNALTTSSEVLGTTDVTWECMIQNDPDNTDDMLIGDATTQSIQLAPGESITIPIDDRNTINLVAVSGTPTANFLCR